MLQLPWISTSSSLLFLPLSTRLADRELTHPTEFFGSIPIPERGQEELWVRAERGWGMFSSLLPALSPQLVPSPVYPAGGGFVSGC